jgi:transcription elongation factor Elf1
MNQSCPKCGHDSLSVEEREEEDYLYTIECWDCGWLEGHLFMTYNQAADMILDSSPKLTVEMRTP